MSRQTFYYEWQHPVHGSKVHFVLKSFTTRLGTRMVTEELKALMRKDPRVTEWVALTNLCVYPALRRQGLADDMLAELVAWQTITKRGVVFVACPYKNSPISRDRLHAMYEIHGFERVGTTEFHIRPPFCLPYER